LTFCMQCCGHPRDLLSFPTRRSSDLGGKLYYAVLTGDWGTLLSRAGLVFWGGLMGGIVVTGIVIAKKKLPVWRIADVAGICVARSEEHTSELQSRENLVCRLLLEKKK